MFELAIPFLVKWAGAAWSMIKGIPWYFLVIAALVAVLLWERHELGLREADLALQATKLQGYVTTVATDEASIATLKGSIADQNKAVDNYKSQTTAAQLASASARAQAAQAAQGRQAALAALKAAEGKPILHDCPAPAAHTTARSQL